MFDLSNDLTKSKYHDYSKKLVVGKMKDETVGLSIKEFVGLKPEIYPFSVDDRSDHKKAKNMNKNVRTINHNEYKNIQSKDHRIGKL